MSTTEPSGPPAGTSPIPERVLAHIAVPFVAVVLIWGTTWIVIRDQLSVVDPSWSIAFRFTAGAAALFAWLAVRRESMRLDRHGHALAVLLGALQFVGNFNFVYRA